MSQTKLIRHNMAAVAPPPAGTTQEVIADPALIKALLVAKLTEEAQEVAKAPTRNALLDELGDVFEVLHSLAALHYFSMSEVENAARTKADHRGPLLVRRQDGRTEAILHRVYMPSGG